MVIFFFIYTSIVSFFNGESENYFNVNTLYWHLKRKPFVFFIVHNNNTAAAITWTTDLNISDKQTFFLMETTLSYKLRGITRTGGRVTTGFNRTEKFLFVGKTEKPNIQLSPEWLFGIIEPIDVYYDNAQVAFTSLDGYFY